MGLAILYRALRLRGREEILSTVHDHFATDEALRLSGGRVRRVRLYDPKAPATASADEIASRLRAAIRPRTRAVAITWVHSSTGVKLPMDEIAAVVARGGRAPRREGAPLRRRRPRARGRGHPAARAGYRLPRRRAATSG